MKLININIEGNKHFDTVIPFLEKERPDVLCLQEVFESDIHDFELLNYTTHFLPMTRKEVDTNSIALGILFCTRNNAVHVSSVERHYYRDVTGTIRDYDHGHKALTVNNGVIIASCESEDSPFTVATTHLTWTPDGSNPSECQKEDTQKLLTFLKTHPSHFLVGDLNIPRHHNPLYETLIAHYIDAIPDSYTTSLDASLHRLGTDADKKHLFTHYMVDHLLIQPPYSAKDVRLEFGISDHAAIVATIEKIGVQ